MTTWIATAVIVAIVELCWCLYVYDWGHDNGRHEGYKEGHKDGFKLGWRDGDYWWTQVEHATSEMREQLWREELQQHEERKRQWP